MTYLLTFITAMVVSMVLIPLMARLAPRIGMVDRPEARKVHVKPIPRAGGVGIVLGALLPLVLWLPFDDLFVAYLFGALVLLAFGAWDDIQELGHYVKFIGQFAAVIAVVFYGDLYVTRLPFMDAELSGSAGRIFTVVAMVGMINAVNHSDGLDGLAGGMSLLSLSAMAYLAYASNGEAAFLIIVALAALGGIVGFLRYNTHPATVFMGDGGSQFLGFTAGFLAVYLMEHVNTAASRALPALLLGLPIVDILAVFAQRIYHGMNWFRASKNHIHHRLLALGFDHYESVVIIYSIQTLFVVSAIFMLYESSALILSLYLGVCVLVFVFLTVAERNKWRAHRLKRRTGLGKIVASIKKHQWFNTLPMRFVSVAIPVFFVLIGLVATQVPRDLGVVSAILVGILLLYLALRRDKDTTVLQVVTYVTAAFVVYLQTRYCTHLEPVLNTIEIVYFVLLAVAIGITVRYGRKGEFITTPMDYLVIFVVLFAGFLLHNLPEKADLGAMAVKLMVLFYGCELIITRMRKLVHLLTVATLVTLTIFAVRGLV
ncbi:MAG: undecaprenyl/decaprenyl-phosphate alpha-N-acetylglucosaminyl 1-phosphate transferase [Sulfuricaulis sp.]|uniref:glycosyltransferase family 4 protein n=1 Tax=Sulfuricaulis sp. TaxID=2003553 RepID=UPI0025EFE12C|nr:MraY family glycosyltransferase [Sulfuricaulis sp.]MCR4347302.1 undecaprenyl/decaprenyl-phosphate alpha-N-acetylglucosaminyl 1-phosphate transferase [Sulfuricaulis sp.]